MTATPLYGKYRGIVTVNVDPLQIGRIQAMVPDAAGFVPSTWAMPCLPMAGINSGVFTAPMIGSGVWIEFERGDPDYPVWVGGYWGSAAEVPVLAHIVPLSPLPDPYSFPSGHSCASMAGAVSLFLVAPMAGIVAVMLAGVVGASRVYLRVHYPTAALVGQVIGAGTALGVWAIL